MPPDATTRSDGHLRRALPWAVALAACLLAAVCLWRNAAWLQDDVFITLRYAAHLAAGHGPLWNVGEQPVEGFTSPLHMLLVAMLLCLHVPPVAAVRLLAMLFHAALVFYIWRDLRRSHGTLPATLAASLVVASWPLLLWDLGGLDAVPFAAAADIGVLLTLKYLQNTRRRTLLQGGLVLGIACFFRPDGAVFAAGVFAACLVLTPKPFSERLRSVALAAALCAAIVLPWQIFRLAYFHAWLPNTWYDKVYGIPLGWRLRSGLVYLRSFLFKAPYLVPALLLVTSAQILRRRWAAYDRALLAVIALYALYIVDCGGDHMPGFRFLIPLLPLLIVALVRGLAALELLQPAPMAWGLSAALLAACAMQVRVQQLDLWAGDGTEMMGADVGRYIDAHWPAGATAGLNAAGATPYFADRLRYIDMLGLNDAVIARRHPIPLSAIGPRRIGHLKGDGAYVLSRRPDFIILSGPTGQLATIPERLSLGDGELVQQPGFHQLYQPCRIELPLSSYNLTHLQRDHPAATIPFVYYQRRDIPLDCPAPSEGTP